MGETSSKHDEDYKYMQKPDPKSWRENILDSAWMEG
jgi:hypothetical protein